MRSGHDFSQKNPPEALDKGQPGEGRQSSPKFACKRNLSWTQGAVKAMLASARTEMRANTLTSAYMEIEQLLKRRKESRRREAALIPVPRVST